MIPRSIAHEWASLPTLGCEVSLSFFSYFSYSNKRWARISMHTSSLSFLVCSCGYCCKPFHIFGFLKVSRCHNCIPFEGRSSSTAAHKMLTFSFQRPKSVPRANNSNPRDSLLCCLTSQRPKPPFWVEVSVCSASLSRPSWWRMLSQGEHRSLCFYTALSAITLDPFHLHADILTNAQPQLTTCSCRETPRSLTFRDNELSPVPCPCVLSALAT